MEFDLNTWLRLGIALACGSLVGLERQLRGKPAGLRTCALICVGAAAFMTLAAHGNATASDMDRVLGQLVVGLGFLGAGVMMNRGPNVTGLTTAAVIWLLAAVGAASGMGRLDMAIGLTAVILLVLVGVGLLESRVARFRKGSHESEDRD